MYNKKQVIINAYKKLKSNVYFDKTQAILREELVKFESENDRKEYNNGIELLYCDLFSKDFAKTNECEDILESINVKCFPKQNRNNLHTFYSNWNNNEDSDGEYQYVIDMDVRGHIISVLWVMFVGSAIDEDLSDSVLGNRLVTENYSTESNLLFKIYHHEYNKWRKNTIDDALNAVKDKTILIASLDIKRFYYSVHCDKDFMENIKKYFVSKEISKIECTKEEYIFFIENLNKFIAEVIDEYSKKFGKMAINDDEKKFSGPFLPIGFLPSCILANLSLKNFDDKIENELQPISYGRYVDDMLFVLNISDINSLGNVSDEDKYFYAKLSKINLINNINDEYKLDSKYTIQKEKTKFFLFKKGETDILLEEFKNSIYRNISEFRSMPEEDFSESDFFEMYKKNGDLCEFHDFNQFTFDKYGLATFLGKTERIASLNSGKNYIMKDGYVNQLLKILTPKILFENYSCWEKLFNILLILNQKEYFIVLLKKCISSIYSCKFEIVKKSLMQFLTSCIKRDLALEPGEASRCFCDRINNELHNVTTEFEIQYTDSLNYISTMMINSYLVAVPLNIILKYWKKNSRTNIKLYNFESICNNLLSENVAGNTVTKNKSNKYIIPYYMTKAQSIISSFIIAAMENTKDELDLFNITDNDNDGVIYTAYSCSIGNSYENKLKIAISSIFQNENMFEAMLYDKNEILNMNNHNITEVINSAIKEPSVSI